MGLLDFGDGLVDYPCGKYFFGSWKKSLFPDSDVLHVAATLVR